MSHPPALHSFCRRHAAAAAGGAGGSRRTIAVAVPSVPRRAHDPVAVARRRVLPPIALGAPTLVDLDAAGAGEGQQQQQHVNPLWAVAAGTAAASAASHSLGPQPRAAIRLESDGAVGVHLLQTLDNPIVLSRGAAPAASPGRTTAARAALQRADSALAFHVSPSSGRTLPLPSSCGRPGALPVRDSSAAFNGGDADDEGATWKTAAPRPVRSSHSLGARTTNATGGSSVSGGLRPGRPVLVLSRADARRSEAPAPAAAHAFLPRWGAAAAVDDPSPLHNITASSSIEAAPGTPGDPPASARRGGGGGADAAAVSAAGSEMRILSSPMFAARALRFGEEPPQQQPEARASASGMVGRRTPIALTARPARAFPPA